MTTVITNKNYLNDVMTLKYSEERDLILKRGELAILIEDYMDGKYDIDQFEVRKSIVEEEIEVLLRTLRG